MMKHFTLLFGVFLILSIGAECAVVGNSPNEALPPKMNVTQLHRQVPAGDKKQSGWTSDRKADYEKKEMNKRNNGRKDSSGKIANTKWTPAPKAVPVETKKNTRNEKPSDSENKTNFAQNEKGKPHNQNYNVNAAPKQTFLPAVNGSEHSRYPFLPMCLGHCEDAFWKSARFEYNWHSSDNFYEYDGYPKAHKWEIHDPHSCIGDWDGRPPGLFVKKNVWVQKGRPNFLGGLVISANAFNPNDAEYRAYFDTHDKCTDAPYKRFKDKRFHQYTTGMVSSVDAVQYGYFEVRAKTMPTQLVNSFWFYDLHGEMVEEIDVFENAHIRANESMWRFDVQSHSSPNAIAAIHYPKKHLVRPKPKHNKHHEPISFHPHTYGLLWTPKKISWFFDGKQFTEINNTHWHRPLRVRFDVETNYELHGIMPDPDDLKDDKMQFIIQYFRSWKVTQ